MKILKTNGKPASNKIQLLADVVMETSLIISWQLTDDMKKEILLSMNNSPWDLEELEDLCEVCLNRATAIYLALISWYSGSNDDHDLDFNSLQKYFNNWGVSTEI